MGLEYLYYTLPEYTAAVTVNTVGKALEAVIRGRGGETVTLIGEEAQEFHRKVKGKTNATTI